MERRLDTTMTNVRICSLQTPLWDEEDANPPESTPSKVSIFKVPAPIKQLFDRFPLYVYPSNDLPQRARRRPGHILYIFTTQDEASRGAPSFNPSCLKWQTFLKFNGIQFTTVSSSNHASPSGALPFLLPALSNTTEPTPAAIAGSKIETWIRKQGQSKKSSPLSDENPRISAYASLLNQPIRLAYLYAIYMNGETFGKTTRKRYVNTCSSNLLVRASLARSLKALALEELLSTSSGPYERVDVIRLYKDAEMAFESLNEFLGENEWFASDEPGMLDAAVFAYTYVLLLLLRSGDRLYDALARQERLVRHRDRILELCFRP